MDGDSDEEDEPTTRGTQDTNQEFHRRVDKQKEEIKENDIAHIVSCHTGDYMNNPNARPNLISLLRRVSVLIL